MVIPILSSVRCKQLVREVQGEKDYYSYLSWIPADKVFSNGGKDGLPRDDLHHLAMCLAWRQPIASQALQVLDIVVLSSWPIIFLF